MDELARLLAVAAEKLGLEAARIWPQVVMITFAKNVFWLVVDALVWIAGIAALVWGWRWTDKKTEELEKAGNASELNTLLTISFVGSLVIGVGLVAALVTAPDHLAGVVAPEAKTVIDLLGKK